MLLFASPVTQRTPAQAAQYGLTLCFLLVPRTGCEGSGITLLLVIGMLAYGLVMGGDVIVPVEVSRHFATTIYAGINMFANLSGVIAPLVIGCLLESGSENDDGLGGSGASGAAAKAAWDSVFYMAAGVVSFGTTIFLLFGSSERQPFDRLHDPEAEEEVSSCP